MIALRSALHATGLVCIFVWISVYISNSRVHQLARPNKQERLGSSLKGVHTKERQNEYDICCMGVAPMDVWGSLPQNWVNNCILWNSCVAFVKDLEHCTHCNRCQNCCKIWTQYVGILGMQKCVVLVGTIQTIRCHQQHCVLFPLCLAHTTANFTNKKQTVDAAPNQDRGYQLQRHCSVCGWPHWQPCQESEATCRTKSQLFTVG